jgi:aspartate/tyrosine/aromatic aminotransferase
MRFMVREGLPVLLIQSFDSVSFRPSPVSTRRCIAVKRAKLQNMALHADSPSILSLVTQSADVKARVESQFRTIARGLYLHPSPWGAYVVRTMLNTPRTYNHWCVKVADFHEGRMRTCV